MPSEVEAGGLYAERISPHRVLLRTRAPSVGPGMGNGILGIQEVAGGVYECVTENFGTTNISTVTIEPLCKCYTLKPV